MIALVGLALLFVGMFVRQFFNPSSLDQQWLRSKNAIIYDAPRKLEAITLIDERARDFDGSEFAGSWNLVFFGYTYCPDICPATMAILKQAVDKLRDRGVDSVQVYLLSVDPARDTPEQLASYVGFFDSEFHGLTGEFLNVHRFATQLNAAFRKVPDEEGSYLMDHSAHIGIIGPQGLSRGALKAPHNIENIVAVMSALNRLKN